MFIYLDDILIFSRSKDEHISHVCEVLLRFLENCLYVKAEKFEFHVSSIKFLGYIIGRGQIEADVENIQVGAEWPVTVLLKHS